MIRRYSKVAMVLHWVVALLILTNVALAWTWPNLADAQVRPAIDLHKSIGITILGLAVLRILWRFGHRPPPLPRGYAKWEVGASHVVHWGLYAILFAMPLTGWIMDSAYKDAASHPMFLYGLFQWPRLGFIMALDPGTKKAVHDGFGAAHEIIAYAVYALVGLHVAGALKHQWLDGTKELQRMWPGRG
uniref:cytochrome b n=1 Tax=uncultured Sphingomonas sp. TaxID=158754 RepID=UPI0035CBD0E9